MMNPIGNRAGWLLAMLLSAGLLLACQIGNLVTALSSSPTPYSTRTLAPLRATVTRTRPAAQVVQPTVALLPTPAALPDVTATTTENLRVRSEPSTNSRVVDRLDKATTILVVGRTEASDWWQVPLPSKPEARGWISAQFVQIDGPAESVPVVEAGLPQTPLNQPYP